MNEFRKPVGVKITGHAVERFYERFPDEVPYWDIKGLIYKEVQQALKEGRRLSKLPSWAARIGHPSWRHRSERYVFNEAQTRCYPIVQDPHEDSERRSEFGISWTVKTTLPRLSDEQLADLKRLRRLERQNTGSGNRSRRAGRAFHGGRRR